MWNFVGNRNWSRSSLLFRRNVFIAKTEWIYAIFSRSCLPMWVWRYLKIEMLKLFKKRNIYFWKCRWWFLWVNHNINISLFETKYNALHLCVSNVYRQNVEPQWYASDWHISVNWIQCGNEMTLEMTGAFYTIFSISHNFCLFECFFLFC